MYSYNLCVNSGDNKISQKVTMETSVPVSSGDKIVLNLSRESLEKQNEKNDSGDICKTRVLVVSQIVHYPNGCSELHVTSKETFDI